MESEVASIILGIGLVIAGAVMLKFYYQRLEKELNNTKDGQPLASHVLTQLRRRFQIAIIILILGFLIPVCENLITEKKPTLYVICMTGVLLLALWIIFLGMIDMMLVRSRNRSALQVLNIRRKELEKQITDIQNQNNYDNDSSQNYSDPSLN